MLILWTAILPGLATVNAELTAQLSPCKGLSSSRNACCQQPRDAGLRPSYGIELSDGASDPLVDVELSKASKWPLVDWGEWPEHLHDDSDSADTGSDFVVDRAVLRRTEENAGYNGSLYHLVDECAQRLELRGVSCDEDARAEDTKLHSWNRGICLVGFR